jgi:hypothetical protein
MGSLARRVWQKKSLAQRSHNKNRCSGRILLGKITFVKWRMKLFAFSLTESFSSPLFTSIKPPTSYCVLPRSPRASEAARGVVVGDFFVFVMTLDSCNVWRDFNLALLCWSVFLFSGWVWCALMGW